MRSRSPRMWISTILPPRMENAITDIGVPSRIPTTPGAPLTSTMRRSRPGRENDDAPRATFSAPRTSIACAAVWAEATKHFDEKALGGILMTIALASFWNRLNVPRVR